MFLYLHSSSQLMKNLGWKLLYNFALPYTEKVSSCVLRVIHTESGMIFRPLDLQLASTTSLWKIVRFLLTNSVHTPFCIHEILIYNHSTSTVNPHANFHCGATMIMIKLYSIWCMRQHYASVVQLFIQFSQHKKNPYLWHYSCWCKPLKLICHISITFEPLQII